MVGSARMQVDGTAGDVAHGSTSSWLGKDHLRLLPPSANWYCSKICDWGRSDVFGLLFPLEPRTASLSTRFAGV
ncbi:hypothetical protein GQ600_13937 [Phytophthora cactorum]|nr:hypothetical protein GQ600_13937 [Phytophthora cactorum]